MFHTAVIAIGSNIQPEINIPKAISLLRTLVEVKIVSNIWETKPVGTDGPNFYNGAVLIRTDLGLRDLKYQVIRKIEDQLGRVRTSDSHAPREIDLDIVVFNDLVMEEALWNQVFVAKPVSELIPDFLNPYTRIRLIDQVAVLNDDGITIRCIPDLIQDKSAPTD